MAATRPGLGWPTSGGPQDSLTQKLQTSPARYLDNIVSSCLLEAVAVSLGYLLDQVVHIEPHRANNNFVNLLMVQNWDQTWLSMLSDVIPIICNHKKVQKICTFRTVLDLLLHPKLPPPPKKKK